MKKKIPSIALENKTLTNSQFIKQVSAFYRENSDYFHENTFDRFMELLRDKGILYSATNFLKSDLYGISRRISRSKDRFVDIGTVMYVMHCLVLAVQDDWYKKMDEKEKYLLKEDYPHPRSV